MNNARPIKNKKRPLLYIYASDLWVVLSTFLTAGAGILSLYGTNKDGGCYYGVAIATTVLQGISLVFCVFGLAAFAWRVNKRLNKDSNSEKKSKKRCLKILSSETSTPAIVQVVVMIIVNIASLVMALLILTNEGGCTVFAYNAAYNIIGGVGSISVTILQSFKPSITGSNEDPNKTQSSIHQHTYSKAVIRPNQRGKVYPAVQVRNPARLG